MIGRVLIALGSGLVGYTIGILHMGTIDSLTLRKHGLIEGSHHLCAICNPDKGSQDA